MKMKEKMEWLHKVLKLEKAVSKAQICYNLDVSPNYAVEIMRMMPEIYPDVVYDKKSKTLRYVEIMEVEVKKEKAGE